MHWLMHWGRKRAGWWVAMVLPGFLLRSLIPLGFMPMFGPGHSLRMMLCPGYAPVASMIVEVPADASGETSMDMSMDMPMDMPVDVPPGNVKPHGSAAEPAGAGRHPPVHQDHAACPYGASPPLATLVLSSNLDVADQPQSHAAPAAPQIAHAEMAPRAQSPRGPP